MVWVRVWSRVKVWLLGFGHVFFFSKKEDKEASHYIYIYIYIYIMIVCGQAKLQINPRKLTPF